MQKWQNRRYLLIQPVMRRVIKFLIIDLLHRLKDWGRVVVVGHSMSAFIATACSWAITVSVASSAIYMRFCLFHDHSRVARGLSHSQVRASRATALSRSLQSHLSHRMP